MISLPLLKQVPADSLPQKAPSKFWILSIISVILLSYGVILGTGMTTPVSLGDEVYHYRFAESSFQLNSRAVIDSGYAQEDPVKIRLVTDPGWPLGLSYLWRLYGKISPQLAQIYHSLYFLILIAGTFLLASALYSFEAALWSALFASTMPMLVSFGILFYSDLPATAFCSLIFFFCCRRNFLAAGMTAALAYLIKKGILCFMPALFVLAVVLRWPDKKKIAGAVLSLLIPVLIFSGLEMAWQVKHIPSGRSTLGDLQARIEVLYKGKASSGSENAVPAEALVKNSWLKIVNILLNVEFSNSHILNPKDEFKYWGIPVPFLLLLSFLVLGFRKPAWILILPCAVYAAAILFLCLLPDIRYWMPIAPFLCILAARILPALKNSILKGTIILICMAQLLMTANYVYRERRISPGLRESFEFIQKNVPPRALFITPDLLILEYTGRRIVWGLCDVRRILWGTEAERRAEIKRIQADYIAVKKDRIYDDSGLKARHIGGYPKSFLEILKNEPFVSPIFENEAVSLWKIDRGKMS